MTSKEPAGPHEYRHQQQYAKAQKEDGFIRVSVWIPPENRAQLVKSAKEFRDAWEKE
jgi:hypothetical protein